MSRKTSCGFAQLLPLPFELVLGTFIALRKQLEDEDKYRQEQEKNAGKEQGIDVSSYMGQARSMMNSAQSMAKVPNVSMPSVPHI